MKHEKNVLWAALLMAGAVSFLPGVAFSETASRLTGFVDFNIYPVMSDVDSANKIMP